MSATTARRSLTLGLLLATTVAAGPVQPRAADAPRWTLGAPFHRLAKPNSDDPAVLLDPCIVHHEGQWHLFAGGPAGIAYYPIDEWKSEGPVIRGRKLSFAGGGVPQVYFHRAGKQWHLIGQMSVQDAEKKKRLVPCLSTNTRIDDPDGWSKLISLEVEVPVDENGKIANWMDFYVIFDDAKAHLFGTSGGRLWRTETKIADFPQGWSKPVLALKAAIVYASHTYRRDGGQGLRYLTTVTSSAPDPATKKNKQYQVSFVADTLDGPWAPEAAQADHPYAGFGNIRVLDERWSGEIIHGEPLRQENDERMILQREDLGFVFHARAKVKNEEGSAAFDCLGFLAPVKK